MGVKNSAIIYSAYDYQTLQGIYLLSTWLDSPTAFERICFEADEENNEAPQGIDDVICNRTDGKTDFWQVKFTPSPEKEENRLNWNWLLNRPGKTERSRSILKKLSDAIASVSTDKLGNVTLLTNKIPDRAVENCLKGSKIDLASIDDETQQNIISQLGSEEVATLLFSKLEIQHSEGDYHTLDRSIRSELFKHADDAGIDRLLNRARQWAMFKDIPSAGGWIYLHQIREILSSRRPEPIPEIFTVPPQYALPDENFHDDLTKQICSSNGEIITLTGNPGQGKSTYLSYICQILDGLEIPLIRHHYFLSLGDTTEDRLSPRIVSESLLNQIESFHWEANADTSRPEGLREALENCAAFYKGQQKPFVVLIDGLDHVWRDNARNRKPLDEIFRQLLPPLENMVLLVGTQPVDDNLLPELLLKFSPKNSWKWLPAMTGNSIFEYLKSQLESGRGYQNCYPGQKEEELKSASEKLLEITNGYPLHVIYSHEFLVQNGKPLSTWQIEKLPPCFDDNIETYYQSLWNKLSHRQRDVLHLCSGFQFAWPRIAIGKILQDQRDLPPSVDAVSHMLFEGFSGVSPFHESLVVFVRSQPDHQNQVSSLLPEVCTWLGTDAPVHLRNEWLWSSQAKSGDTSPLRTGLTRDWLLDRLIEGFPVKAGVRLLSEAETYALEEFQFSEAYAHRALKTRLINGPQFQIWDKEDLEIYSLLFASDSAIDQAVSSENYYSPTKLAVLSISLWHRNDHDRAAAVSRKAIDYYRTKNKLLSSRHRQDEEKEAAIIIKAGALTDTLNYDAIFEGDNFTNWPDEYVSALVSACIVKRDISLLLRARNSLGEKNNHRCSMLEIAAIRTSIVEESDITARTEFELFKNKGLAAILNTLTQASYNNISTHFGTSTASPPIQSKPTTSYYQWFFSALNTRLTAEGDFSWLPVQVEKDRKDLSAHFNMLTDLADKAGQELINSSALSFDYMCTIFPTDRILDDTDWEADRAEIELKRDWIEISGDCHLVTTRTPISRAALDSLISSEAFRTEWLRIWYKEHGLKVLDDYAADCLIDLESTRFSRELEQTIDYSNGGLELVEIALRHDGFESFNKHLRITWDFVLGYGHHKDTTILDVLSAIKYLSSALSNEAIDLLERISPIISNILEFTDGDETNHSKHSISTLLATLNPQTCASIYDCELGEGEWLYAEESLSALISKADFSLPIVQVLHLTGLHISCYRELLEQIDAGNQEALNISQSIESFLGIEISEEVEERNSSDTHYEKIDIEPAEYPPERFDDLNHALKGKISASDFWESWYQYWTEQGKEADLIDCLLPKIGTLTEPLNDKRYLLDRLFASQKKLNGKTKAFDLLVAAQRTMNGWSDWFERTSKSLDRLKIVSKVYPDRINEFIKLTTEQPDSWQDRFGKLIVPNDKLVYLLTESGRIEEARAFTTAMVQCLEESTRNLSLKKPAWDWKRGDTIEEALTKALVSRLKSPVPSIKVWVAEQISNLLAQSYSKIEDLVLNDLASRQQESECIEVLSVILMAKDKGYSPPNTIGDCIKARSVLSDMILKDLGISIGEFGNYALDVSPITNIPKGNHRFDYFLGSHFPQMYQSLLGREEEKTGIPFTSYFRSEWSRTFDYCPASGTDIHFYFSYGRNRNTGQFYTTASHRGRSAFLRTIEIANQYFGMPDGYAEDLATAALPIEPAYMGTIPQKPHWISPWQDLGTPTEKSINDYLIQCIREFTSSNPMHDLAAMSLPIKIDKNTWIDITAVQVKTNQPFPSVFDIEERSQLSCNGIGLERHLTYMNFDNEQEFSESEISLTGTAIPLLRFGHWYSDLESRGLYAPISRVQGKNIMAKHSHGLIEFQFDDLKIGHCGYWVDHWKPVHPKYLRSLYGTYTILDQKLYSKWAPQISIEATSFYACKATVIKAESSHDEFEIQEISFLIPDKDSETRGWFSKIISKIPCFSGKF